MSNNSEWVSVLGLNNNSLDKEKYRKVYSQKFFQEIFKDFDAKELLQREKIEEIILGAATIYELYRHNHQNFYNNKTDKKQTIDKFVTGLKKSKLAYKELNSEYSKRAGIEFFQLLSFTFENSPPESLHPYVQTLFTAKDEGFLFDRGSLESLLNFLLKGCEATLKHIDNTPLQTATDALIIWASNFEDVLEESEITFTSKHSGESSKAEKILIKIIKKLDNSIGEKSLAHAIKEAKTKS